MKTRIILDSTADVFGSNRARFRFVPLTLHFGEDEYLDGVDIDHKTFYEKLIETDVMPTTSQASPSAFEKEFILAKEAGEAALVITLSQKLSGTYQSAMIAAKDFDNVYIVDSENVTIGSGILAELALRYVDEGMEVSEIVKKLESDKKNIVLVALFDTLEYLKRGGRISGAAAFAGSVLNIKPVVALSSGEIHVLGKARGSKQGNNYLVEEIGKAGGVDFSKPILLGFSGLSDVILKKYIEDSKFLWECGTDNLRCTEIGSVIGTHAGPGAIGVAFFKKD